MKRWVEWGRLISITGLVQILVQVLGLLSGIAIIRLLPTTEFALYTLANAVLATIMVLADSGIGAGILASGGRVWQNPKALGSVVKAGIALRKRFALITLMIALPVLWCLLLRHGANWLMALGILFAIIPAFFASLSDTLYELPLKLKQDIGALQKNQLLANLSRFVILTSSLYFLPFTIVALIGTGFSRIWANVALRKRAFRLADLRQAADPLVKTEIAGMLKRTMPSTIYYCLSGQLTIWLISIFGNTTGIAQLGALERVVGVVGVIGIVFTTLVIPRFARLQQDAALLLSWFVKILGLLIGISVCVCLAFYFLADQVLLVLGPRYSNLQLPLLLVSIGSCLKLMAGIANYLSVARGWAIQPSLHIIVSVLVQILLIAYLDLTVLNHILVISMVNGLVALLLYCGYFFYRGFGVKAFSYG